MLTLRRVFALLLALGISAVLVGCTAEERAQLGNMFGDEAPTAPAVPVDESEVTTALDVAYQADSGALSAYQEWMDACPSSEGSTAAHVCGETTKMPLQAAMDKARTTCAEKQEAYNALFNRPWKDGFMGEYYKLTRDTVNPLTGTLFTCGNP